MKQIALNKNIERSWQIERSTPLTPFLAERLVISTHKYIHLPLIRDILYLQSENNYCRIHLVDSREILASKTLKHLAKLLENKGFLRIHSSYLVNLNKVIGISRNGHLYIELDNQQKLPISAKYRPNILNAIRNAEKI